MGIIEYLSIACSIIAIAFTYVNWKNRQSATTVWVWVFLFAGQLLPIGYRAGTLGLNTLSGMNIITIVCAFILIPLALYQDAKRKAFKA
jgi:hypothetical protein